MAKKYVSVKVQIDGHHQEKYIEAERFDSLRYPSLKLCFHKHIEGIDENGKLIHSRKYWTLTDIETGYSIFSRQATKIKLELQLYDLIEKIGLDDFVAKIDAAKNSNHFKGLEQTLWRRLHRYGLTLTQGEIFDLIEELKNDGIELIYYEVEKENGS